MIQNISTLNIKMILNIILLFILSYKTRPIDGALTPTPRPTMRPTSITSSSDPKVLDFTFQAATGAIFITFDQAIIASSFDSSKISVQGTRNRTKGANIAYFYIPFNNLADEGNTTFFQFFPTKDDFARVTLFPDVAISAVDVDSS